MRLIDADSLKDYIDCGHLRPPTEVCFSELDVCNMIDKAPTVSAEAVQGWIPVEEQPPVFPCLVCDANGNQPSVPLGVVTITDEEHGKWHIDGRLWDTKIFFKGGWCSQTGYGNRIIAWMPLPKPYKAGDSE